ncbi:hypothetical protein GGR57DRAFT_277104 [Xylariaceae sp. FL1272]|nr:hypothetical protein GGR57DRAFT_277104 [Xylariaceae sp. FL1272]
MLAVLKEAAESDTSPHHVQIRNFLQARLAERHRSHAAAAKKAALPPRPDKSTAPKPGTLPLLVNVTPEPTPENPKPKIVYDTPNRPLRKGQLGGTGKRKIPHMDMMGDFPFMRFTKPQPRIIHRVLFNKYRKRELRMEMRQEFTQGTREDMVLEDDWEKSVADLIRKKQGLPRLEAYEWAKPDSKVKWKLLSREKQVKKENEWIDENDAGSGMGGDFRSYAWTLHEHGVEYLTEKLWRQREQNIAMADAMRKLIIEEKRLAAEERIEDRRNKYIAGKKKWQAKMKAKHGDEWYIVANQNRKRRKAEEEKNQQDIRKRNIMKRAKLLAWMKEKSRAKIRREHWAKVKVEKAERTRANKVRIQQQLRRKLKRDRMEKEGTLEWKPWKPSPTAARPVTSLSSPQPSREKPRQEREGPTLASSRAFKKSIPGKSKQESTTQPIVEDAPVHRKRTKEERTAAYQQRLKDDAQKKEQRIQEQEGRRRQAEQVVDERQSSGEQITDPELLRAKKRLEYAEIERQFEKGQLTNPEQAKHLAKEARIKKHADLLVQHQKEKARKPRWLTKAEIAQKHSALILQHAKEKAQRRLDIEINRTNRLEKERMAKSARMKTTTPKVPEASKTPNQKLPKEDKQAKHKALTKVQEEELMARGSVARLLEAKRAKPESPLVPMGRAPKINKSKDQKVMEASRLSPEDKKARDEARRKGWEEKMLKVHGENWRELMVKSRGKVATRT